MNIASLIRNLVTETEHRNDQQTTSCTQITPDSNERKTIYEHIKETQEDIDKIVDQIRESTGNGFSDFSDEELLLACYIWASVWTDHPAVQITSRSMVDIVGRNRVGRIPDLIERLLSKKSPLISYVEMQWQSRYRGECCYTFHLKKPVEFNALFLRSATANE